MVKLFAVGVGLNELDSLSLDTLNALPSRNKPAAAPARPGNLSDEALLALIVLAIGPAEAPGAAPAVMLTGL